MRVLCFTAALLWAASSLGLGQGTSDAREAPVELNGSRVFQVVGNASFSATERAMIISHRLEKVAADETIPVDAIAVKQAGDVREITAGGIRLMEITAADAQAMGRDASDLASDFAHRMRAAVRAHREHWGWRRLVRAMALAVLAAALFAATLLALSRSVRWARHRVLAFAVGRSIGFGDVELVTGRQIAIAVSGTLSVVRWVVTLALIRHGHRARWRCSRQPRDWRRG